MKKLITIIILSFSIQICNASNVISLPYITSDIVYSKTHDKLYALIDAMDTEYGNRLLEINISTGAVERSLFVGSQPRFIRLTTDENYAWISFYGIPFINRIDLNAFEIDKEVYLGPSKQHASPNHRNSHIISYNFTVFPNDNNKLALGLKNMNVFNFEAIALYKNDTIQPNRILDVASFYHPSCLEPTLNGDYLVGHYQSTGISVFSTIKVLDNGVEYMNQHIDLIQPALRRDWIMVHNDTLCIADGTVLDATDISTLEVVGNCKNDIIGDLYGFTYSDIHNAFVYPNINNDSIYLTFYNRNTFVAFDSVFLLEYHFNQIMMIPQLEVIDNNRFAIEIGKDYGNFTIRIIETKETGTEAISSKEQLEIYPNPASNKLFIKGFPINKRISVYNITGKLIETYEQNGMIAEIVLNNYNSGAYILKITDIDNNNYFGHVKKIVIQ